jgi:hypothetical protein
MHRAMICINPTAPDAIGFTTGAGLPGDVRFDFKDISGMAYPNVDTLFPQLVLRPFTTATSYGYDITVDDVIGASGLAAIPASAMTDRFSVEVYSRNDAGQPQSMLACGKIDLTGYAYMAYSPLAPASYSVGPAGAVGAPGAAGAPGMRGSRWYTGAGAPGIVPDDRSEGDMYLDENNGDVWRWSGGTWTTFKGTAT